MLKKLIIASLFLGAAALSPAPIGDKGPLKMEHERGQAQVTEEQGKYQMSQGQIGSVPSKTDGTWTQQPISDAEGGQALTAAMNQKEAAGAAQVLAEASRTMSGANPGFPWIWAVVMAILGLGGVMGLRIWANKLAPVPDNFRLPQSKN